MKTAFVTFIGLAGAAFYSLGYWLTFGIDPFPFMTVAEFGLYSLKALLVFALPAAFAFCLGTISKGGPKSEKEALAFSFRRDGVLVLVGIGMAFAGFLSHRRELLFAGLFFAIGSLASFRLVAHPLFSALSEDRVLRHLMIVALFGVPVFPLGAGIASASETVREGKRVVATWNADGRHLVGRVYIGHIGDYDFFWDERTKTTEIARSDTLGGFAIQQANKAPDSMPDSGTPAADAADTR